MKSHGKALWWWLRLTWFRVHSFCKTFTKSKITLLSQPKWISRFLNPISKSITQVLWPCSARPYAKLAAVVVFPTPPFPEVTVTTFEVNVAFKNDLAAAPSEGWRGDKSPRDRAPTIINSDEKTREM